MKSLYFAYGSNLDRTQLLQRCQGTIHPRGKASLDNWAFIINSRGVATIVPENHSEVHGFLWLLDEDQFARLDSYEGVPERLYRRTALLVRTEIAQELDAQVYIATDNRIGTPRRRYMQAIVAAAKQLELPHQYIGGLVERWPTTED